MRSTLCCTVYRLPVDQKSLIFGPVAIKTASSAWCDLRGSLRLD